VAVGEAMACGVSCVVTDVGDSAYLVGDTGLVVPPRDPAALANAWLKLLELSSENRRKLGLAARARVQSQFNVTTIAARYEEVYHSVVDRQPSPLAS
jgi:glycosyltransferase involved in cell wall biosynthesis